MRHNYHGDLGRGLLPCPRGDVRSSGEEACNDVVTAASGDFGNRAVGPPRRGTGGRQERRTTLWGPVTPKANRGKTLRRATAARPVDPDGRPHLSNRQQPVSARQGKAIGSGLLLSRRWQGGRPGQGRIAAALLPLAMGSARLSLPPSRGGKQQRFARPHAAKRPAGQRPRHPQAKGPQTITAASARGRMGAETSVIAGTRSDLAAKNPIGPGRVTQDQRDQNGSAHQQEFKARHGRGCVPDRQRGR